MCDTLAFYLWIFLSICESVHLSICLSICLSIYLFSYLSINQSIHLSICILGIIVEACTGIVSRLSSVRGIGGVALKTEVYRS